MKRLWQRTGRQSQVFGTAALARQQIGYPDFGGYANALRHRNTTDNPYQSVDFVGG